MTTKYPKILRAAILATVPLAVGAQTCAAIASLPSGDNLSNGTFGVSLSGLVTADNSRDLESNMGLAVAGHTTGVGVTAIAGSITVIAGTPVGPCVPGTWNGATTTEC